MPVREPGLRLLSGAANAHRGLDGQPAAGPVRGTVGTSRLSTGACVPQPPNGGADRLGPVWPRPRLPGLMYPNPQNEPRPLSRTPHYGARPPATKEPEGPLVPCLPSPADTFSTGPPGLADTTLATGRRAAQNRAAPRGTRDHLPVT